VELLVTPESWIWRSIVLGEAEVIIIEGVIHSFNLQIVTPVYINCPKGVAQKWSKFCNYWSPLNLVFPGVLDEAKPSSLLKG
jgi:hypothetical protein